MKRDMRRCHPCEPSRFVGRVYDLFTADHHRGRDLRLPKEPISQPVLSASPYNGKDLGAPAFEPFHRPLVYLSSGTNVVIVMFIYSFFFRGGKCTVKLNTLY